MLLVVFILAVLALSFCLQDLIETEVVYGFIDFKGKYSIAPKFAYAENFSEGYAKIKVQKHGEYGYIDILYSVLYSI